MISIWLTDNADSWDFTDGDTQTVKRTMEVYASQLLYDNLSFKYKSIWRRFILEVYLSIETILFFAIG